LVKATVFRYPYQSEASSVRTAIAGLGFAQPKIKIKKKKKKTPLPLQKKKKKASAGRLLHRRSSALMNRPRDFR